MDRRDFLKCAVAAAITTLPMTVAGGVWATPKAIAFSSAPDDLPLRDNTRPLPTKNDSAGIALSKAWKFTWP
jgi:hypothetical protein